MIVKKKFYTLKDKLVLDCKKELSPVTVAYETYGTLNDKKDNAILICHAMTGDSHVAGRYTSEDKKPGWWDNMVGIDKPFDTEKYFIICSNILGGCQGTTGPGSINPKTEKEYALDFPVVTIEDMVRVEKSLLEHLNIKSLYCIAGGSLGGMQALVWTLEHPKMVKSVAIIASSAYTSTQGIAFHKVGRNAIASDENWKNGNYYGGKRPEKGLAIARMIGHITYLSDESMRNKFSRNLQDKKDIGFELTDDFAVESYLEHQGDAFIERFDANSYLYISKAMDYFDIPGKYGSFDKAFNKVKSKFLIVSFTSDWLYPSYHSKEVVKSLMRCKKDVSFCEINSPYGHDAFLLEGEKLGRIITSFLTNING